MCIRVSAACAFELAGGKKTDFVTNEPVIAADRLYAAEVVKDRPVIRAYDAKKTVVWELEADGSGDLILAGDRLFAAGDHRLVAVQLPQGNQPPRITWSAAVEGDVVRLLAANGKLIAVTLDGRIMAFGAEKKAAPAVIAEQRQPIAMTDSAGKRAAELLTGEDLRGYALWLAPTICPCWARSLRGLPLRNWQLSKAIRRWSPVCGSAAIWRACTAV